MSEGIEDERTTVWTPKELAFYLSIYYSDNVDWLTQLDRLKSKKLGALQTKKQVAYTILSPVVHHTRPTTPVEALLFVGFKFSDFDDLDWITELEKLYEEDTASKALRAKLLELGSVHPVEYDVRSRQALKWLCEQASADSSIQDSEKGEVVNRFKNLILIYGSSSVCSLFQRPEIKAQFLPQVSNWRTGYFVEKQLTKHFNHEQLLEMKARDMEKAPKELTKFFVSQTQSS